MAKKIQSAPYIPMDPNDPWHSAILSAGQRRTELLIGPTDAWILHAFERDIVELSRNCESEAFRKVAEHQVKQLDQLRQLLRSGETQLAAVQAFVAGISWGGMLNREKAQLGHNQLSTLENARSRKGDRAAARRNRIRGEADKLKSQDAKLSKTAIVKRLAARKDKSLGSERTIISALKGWHNSGDAVKTSK